MFLFMYKQIVIMIFDVLKLFNNLIFFQSFTQRFFIFKDIYFWSGINRRTDKVSKLYLVTPRQYLFPENESKSLTISHM